MTIDDLDTPSLLVDLDRLERNIVRMAAIARDAGVALRPHAKTHKIPQIGHLQLAAGSPGLTVAKLGEAEVFADGGIADLFIAYPLWGELKWERLCLLARRAQVCVAADSYEVIEGISRTALRHGLRIPIRLEVDSGFQRCGLQTPDEVRALAGRMEGLRGVQLVGAYEEPFLEIPLAHWDRTIAVNLRGMFLVGQRVARDMVRARHGTIVLTSSTNGLVGEDKYAHYNASKGGVTLLTKSMAIELGPYNIRVNAVCPGYIVTPLAARIDSAEFMAAYAATLPLRRLGKPEEVAALFAFLASEDAAFITGELVVIDGGQLTY